MFRKNKRIKVEGETMKIIFVFLLLLVSLMSLIIMLDMIMGSNFNQALPNLRKPFEVSESSEYFIITILIGFLVLKPVVSYLMNKRTKTSSNKN
jgi:hypothetical protein